MDLCNVLGDALHQGGSVMGQEQRRGHAAPYWMLLSIAQAESRL